MRAVVTGRWRLPISGCGRVEGTTREAVWRDVSHSLDHEDDDGDEHHRDAEDDGRDGTGKATRGQGAFRTIYPRRLSDRKFLL